MYLELGGDLPHGEPPIVVKLQHLLLPLREHLLAGKAQIPAQPLQVRRVIRGAFPLPVGQIRQKLTAFGVQTDLIHR